ncbi:MAG: carbon-nitrogen hydrolase family protein [Rhodobacteraceae bacterium]|nr:carbon-nitrogen hydrolase family protein [Paracoccaceae bacterium]
MTGSVPALKVGIWQDSGRVGDIAENLAFISRATEHAARCGVDLLIFPECFLTGYFNGNAVDPIARQIDRNTVFELQVTARSNATAILVGYYEAKEAGVHNSAMLIGADGKMLANYRKRALFGDWERRVFIPGRKPVLAVFNGIRIAVLICFDIEFPELARECARIGADLIAVPTSLMKPNGHIAERLIPARAIENQVYVAYANRIGREHGMHFVGKSVILDPDGVELARASCDLPELIYADISRSTLNAARFEFSYLGELRSLFGAAVAD